MQLAAHLLARSLAIMGLVIGVVVQCHVGIGRHINNNLVVCNKALRKEKQIVKKGARVAIRFFDIQFFFKRLKWEVLNKKNQRTTQHLVLTSMP